MEKLLRFLSRIWIRLLAFNALLIFLPAVGILTFNIYEQKLRTLQERSMVQQGRILAAALGHRGEIDPEEAERILVNMDRRTDARLRVFDRDLRSLADSSQFGPRSDEAEPSTAPDEEEREPRESLLYRLGLFLYRPYERIFLPPEPPARDSELEATVEEVRTRVVRTALEGRYDAGLAVSKALRSLTMYSALPIRDGERIVGAVLVSKSTFRILQDLYELRLSTFKVVLGSVGLAVILSLLVSTTIAQPLRRLQREAKAILDRRGRLKGRFRGSQRRDEIGDLSRALAELTRRLEGHLRFIESFASDVSHEFKNPLATIRNATEILADAEDPEERRRFIRMVLEDIARLEHLLAGVREITHIDATLDEQAVEPVELGKLLGAFVERYRLQSGNGTAYRLDAGPRPLTVTADPERLAQVFENLLDNATGFSPADGTVTLSLVEEGREAVVTLRDEGPGIPEEHLDRIFDRFFSYRSSPAESSPAPPPNGSGGHTGLGLAIVKAIVEGYGGSVRARNGDEKGSVFEVRLPLMT